MVLHVNLLCNQAHKLQSKLLLKLKLLQLELEALLQLEAALPKSWKMHPVIVKEMLSLMRLIKLMVMIMPSLGNIMELMAIKMECLVSRTQCKDIKTQSMGAIM